MITIKNLLFTLVLLFILCKCTGKSNLDPIDELVLCRIDFQSGFEGHYIDLRINEKIYFIGWLSEEVPFSGPSIGIDQDKNNTFRPKSSEDLDEPPKLK